MKNLKLVSFILTIFSLLIGYMGIVSMNIAFPFMILFLGIVLIVNSIEFYKQGEKTATIVLSSLAGTLYLIMIYGEIYKLFIK